MLVIMWYECVAIIPDINFVSLVREVILCWLLCGTSV